MKWTSLKKAPSTQVQSSRPPPKVSKRSGMAIPPLMPLFQSSSELEEAAWLQIGRKAGNLPSMIFLALRVFFRVSLSMPHAHQRAGDCHDRMRAEEPVTLNCVYDESGGTHLGGIRRAGSVSATSCRFPGRRSALSYTQAQILTVTIY